VQIIYFYWQRVVPQLCTERKVEGWRTREESDVVTTPQEVVADLPGLVVVLVGQVVGAHRRADDDLAEIMEARVDREVVRMIRAPSRV
jgi:hypothetical protein